MQQYRMMFASLAIAMLGGVPAALAQRPAPSAPQQPGSTLDRVRVTGLLKLGYRTDARPLSFRDESGNPAGFTVDLCTVVADRLKAERGHGTLTVQWVPVEAADRFAAVAQGRVDVLCGADTETLARRAEASFSIPIFPGGIGALIRSDASATLKDALLGQKLATRPNWRGTANQLLQVKRFAVVPGTTAEGWLAGRLAAFQVQSKVTPVDGYDAGVKSILDRKSDVFFADRAILLDAARRNESASKLMVHDRLFTNEALALAFARGDEDFRLFIDRTLSMLYSGGTIFATYNKWFGAPSESVRNFYSWVTLPN
jgi:putrescine:ornithine antiporter